MTGVINIHEAGCNSQLHVIGCDESDCGLQGTSDHHPYDCISKWKTFFKSATSLKQTGLPLKDKHFPF